jgi:hypothetical protein
MLADDAGGKVGPQLERTERSWSPAATDMERLVADRERIYLDRFGTSLPRH